jgi:hypothetical protein
VINFRYHLVSLVAVFLALTVGVVLGTVAMNGPVLSGLRTQVADLTAQRASGQRDVRDLRQRLARDNEFAAMVAPKVVAGRLKGRTVVLVAAENAGAAEKDAVQRVLQSAGARVTGRLQLMAGYADPRRAAELRAYATGDSLPAGFQLPESGEASVLGAALLSYLLVGQHGGADRPAPKDVTPKDVTQVLTGLASLQLVHVDSSDVAPADCAVLVTAGQFAGAAAADRVRAVTDLAEALGRAGRGIVVAGDSASAGGNGVLGQIRADRSLAAGVSTVDNADTAAGQIATVYAVAEQAAGRSGQYGQAANADATFPAV